MVYSRSLELLPMSDASVNERCALILAVALIGGQLLVRVFLFAFGGLSVKSDFNLVR